MTRDQRTPPEGGDQSTESTPTETTPNRPREIRLDDMDPCTLIPESDYPDFYFEEPGNPEHNETFDAPACAWDQSDVGYFEIVLVTSEGIEVWRDGSRNVEARETAPILDFPAVEYNLPDNEDRGCFVAVDVADGQYLDVQVGVLETRASQVPPPCEYAHQFAESAMSTLVKQ